MTCQLVNRRRFLAASVAAAGTSIAPGPTVAIEPIRRDGPQRLRLSLAAYSLRRYLAAKPGSEGAIDIEGFVDYCHKLKLDGTELTSYYFPKQVTDEFLDQLKKRVREAGLIVSGGAIGNNFTHGPGPELDAQIEHTRRWIRYYARLGAPAIRVFAGRPPKGVSEDEAIRRCVPVLEKLSEEAGKHNIRLALENHDFTTQLPRLMAIVKAVKSKWFGVNFDSGNFHSDDPYADMAAIAPYSINAQIKTDIRRAGKPAEPADLPRVIKILRDAGYSGWIVLEYEAREDPYKAIPNYIDRLRKIIAT